jgi:gamma-glutamyl hydrolase
MKSEKLRDFYNILAIVDDKKDVPILSTIEAKNYPFYAVMFHPERPLYDWNKNFNNPKQFDARHKGRFYQIFFNIEARKSFAKFESEEELQKQLIYNYKIEPMEGIYDTIYSFPMDK